MKLQMKNIVGIIILFSGFSVYKGQVISTVAGNGTAGYSGDNGQATSAKLNKPKGLATDAAGNLYIADFGNHRVRKVTPSGIITTIAGVGTPSFSGDGGAATSAHLNSPISVAVDASNNIYIADEGNNRIRKVDNTGIITTIAGDGNFNTGDGGPAISAGLLTPSGIALGGYGNIYISEYNCRTQKINSAGIINTVAGTNTCSYSGDGGPATSAGFSLPAAVAVDIAGNIFIADIADHVLRKINTSGIITTIAGNGIAGSSGDGGPAAAAQLNNPDGVAVDCLGNIYIAEGGGSSIRMINTSGVITTVIGTGVSGNSGDGGPANIAQISVPTGITIDLTGSIYISDYNNSNIRKVTYNINNSCGVGIAKPQPGVKSASVFPNPFSTSTKIKFDGFINGGELYIYNCVGERIRVIGDIHGNETIIERNGLIAGIYFYELKAGVGNITGKIIISD